MGEELLTMKKLPGLLLLIIIALQPGCKKNNDTINDIGAHIQYGGAVEADGIGYYMKLDNSQEIVIPINLSSTFKHTDVNAAVAVKFIDTGKRFYYGFGSVVANGYRGVYIVTVRKQ